MNRFRKIAHVMMAALLLVSTNGFTLSKHYCMGSLKELSVTVAGHEDHIDSSCGGMEMMMECCDDEVLEMKVDDLKGDASSISFDINHILPFPKHSLPPELLFLDEVSTPVFYADFSPPDDYQEDIYIVNQVFRL